MRKVSLLLTLLILSIVSISARAQQPPVGYQFKEVRDIYTGYLTQTVFPDEATIGLKAQNGEEIKILTIANNVATTEQALVFIYSEKKKTSKQNSFAPARLVVDNESIAVTPCKILERNKSGKLYIVAAGMQISLQTRDKILNGKIVKAQCGDVVIQPDATNLEALQYFAEKIGLKSHNPKVTISSTDAQANNPANPNAEPESISAEAEDLIDRSETYYTEGVRAIENNDFLLARIKFDRAVEIILTGGVPINTYSSLKKHYDSLVNRIYEIEASTPSLPKSNRSPSSAGTITPPAISTPSSTTNNRPKTVSVDGYYRKDGTYVRPHKRSAPRRRN